MSHWTELHDALQTAIADPLEADCTQLCRLMDDCLIAQSDADCLHFGGSAIVLIAEVLFLKMQQFQESAIVEEVMEPAEGFPSLGEEDDQWERHTMSLDLDDDEEDWGKTKKPRPRSPSGSTAALMPPKQVLKMLKELAGNDDPASWSSAISQWLKQQKRVEPIPVSILQQSIQVRDLKKSMRPLSIVELWMGLLLGGFPLQQTQSSEEDFYRELSESSIWVLPVAEK